MTDETTQALLPCPFCGHAEMHAMLGVGGGDRGYSMLCGGCGVRQGSAGRSQSEAITAWNTRLAHSRPSQASDAGCWRPMDSAPRDGTRVNLCWNDCLDLSPHVELGKWKASAGWCNTYGKPFHGDPDMWMPLPPPPSLATLTAPPTSGEEMRLVPVEPTEEMYLAAFASDHWGGVQPIRRVVDEIWSSMLRAALTEGAE